MSRQEAMRFQLEHVVREADPKFAMSACNFTSEKDRVDFMRYYRTKALYEDSATTTMVGSVVMNTVCDEIGIRQHFGSCVETFPTNILTAAEDSSSKAVSFFDRIRSYFEKKIALFSQHLRIGTLHFTPKLATISIDSDVLLEEMAATNPFVVSWSNVPDYISPSEFHTIARRISGPDTVHILHSCNWTQRVFGTDIYDINESRRLLYYSVGLLRIEQCHSFLLGVRRQGVYHVRDICTAALASQYVKNYLRYFFRGQEVVCGCFNGITPLTLCSPFTHNIQTAFLFFAYKETGISFKLSSYNYLDDDDEA